LVRDDGNIDFNWGIGAPEWNVVASDNFSARWTRSLNFAPGRYQFTLIADDGARLWVNGQLVVNKWLDSNSGTYFAELDLPGGPVSLQMEYFENVGSAVARLGWLKLSGGVAVSNWRGEYFNNKDLSGTPVVVRDDAGINFDWNQGSPLPGIVSSDNFSVRWTRNLNMSAGRYRFTVATDDGVRLWVNNSLVIDNWKNQSLTTKSADLDLPNGSVPIRMEYFDSTGGAHAHLSWSQVNVNIVNWRGEYYNNSSLSGGPSVIRDDANINFNWGDGSPASGINNDNFSVRWTRSMVLNPGRYRFTTSTDDGVRLWVNNQLIIDRWYNQALSNGNGEVELYGGPVSIKMEYFDSTGGAQANLSWTQLTVPPTGGPTNNPGQGGVGTATVRSTLLNVRQGPAVSNPIITTISRGTVVTLAGYRNAAGTWVQLTLANGQQGWSYAPFLQTTYNISSLAVWNEPGTGGNPNSGAAATVYGAYYLNVRSGPGTSYAPFMTIARGSVVTLIGRNSAGTWLKIQTASGTQGWSSASYLQTNYNITDLVILTN
jgi:uncharacterized protein YraI